MNFTINRKNMKYSFLIIIALFFRFAHAEIPSSAQVSVHASDHAFIMKSVGVCGYPVLKMSNDADSLSNDSACIASAWAVKNYVNGRMASIAPVPSLVSYFTNDAEYIKLADLSWANVTGKPIFATVATTGSYNNLNDKPSIPAAQVQSDWTASSGVSAILNKPSSFDSIKLYNSSGQVNRRIKIWAETITPSTGNGLSVDISSAGFSTILSVHAVSEYTSGTTSTMRNVELKSISTSAIVVNIAQPNATAIALLGLTLLGVPSYIGSGTGTKLHVVVYGY